MNQLIARTALPKTILNWCCFSLILAIIGLSFASRYGRFLTQWLGGIRGRDWSAISAVIDVVSVIQQTEQGRYGEYIVGYLANLIPIPGGVGVLEGGLAGTLILYGAPAAQAAAGVLIYHAIAFWIPSVGGLFSYRQIRRELAE